MSRDEADQLLLEEDGEDGRYLIRESSRTKGQMTLSLRFNGLTKNFRLFYDGGQHFVNELKRFDTLHDLVADGLITLYVELHASDYITNIANQCRYEESPYMTLHKGRLPLRNSSAKLQCLQPDVGNRALNRRSNAFDRIRQITSHEELAADDEIDERFNSSHQDNQINVLSFEKAHSFKTHTFIGSPWCDFCGNFIWGLIGQGVRCDGTFSLAYVLVLRMLANVIT